MAERLHCSSSVEGDDNVLPDYDERFADVPLADVPLVEPFQIEQGSATHSSSVQSKPGKAKRKMLQDAVVHLPRLSHVKLPEQQLPDPLEGYDIEMSESLLSVAKRKKLQDANPESMALEQNFPDPFDDYSVEMSDPFQSAYHDELSREACETSSTDACDSSSTDHESNPDDSSPFNDNLDFGDEETFSFDPSSFPAEPVDDDTPRLFPGSTLSLMQAIAILSSWFTAFPGISKEAFSRLLYLLHSVLLPTANTLPTTYAAAMAVIRPYLLPVEDYHCCINDCIVYRNSGRDSYEDLTECPVCSEPRYVQGTHTPRKRFKYVPLTPRFKRFYNNSTTSQLLQSHSGNAMTQMEVVSSLHQSEAWKSWYGSGGTFDGDTRALSLGVGVDGVNPYSKEKTTYSMWPIIVTTLNLPPRLRVMFGSMMLVGIIPGKSEPKNTDPYLDILVDELLALNGCVVHDGYRNENFTLKAEVKLYYMDYPGQNKVFHCQGAGAYAGCCYCCIHGEYSKTLKKMVYLGHRQFLSPDDPLNKDRRHFPHKTDPQTPPMLKTMKYVDAANGRYCAASTSRERKLIAQETGCKGSYAFRRLPGHDRIMNTPVDPMHLIKNVSEHIVHLISGVEDSHKVRAEERGRNRLRSSWVEDPEQPLPPAPFRLRKDELRTANERAVSVKVPVDFDWKPRHIFKASGMKSHEWKQVVSSGILKYCLRKLLGKNQRTTLFHFCDVMARLCSEEISEVDSLETDLHRAVALLERDFPVSLNVIVFHLLHHLPTFLRQLGPVYGFWMYPLERFNSWITRRVMNRRFPEATVFETYRAFELAHFLQISKQLPEGSLVDSFQHMQDEDHPHGEAASSKDRQHHIATLDPLQLQQLDEFYQQTLKVYSDLCTRYREELAKAHSLHRLRRFPDMSEWDPRIGPTLSPTERQMCLGPSSDIVKFKRYTFHDKHMRTVTLRCEDSENADSCTCSSYIFAQGANDIVFGRIKFMFEHTFNCSTLSLGYVNWYNGYITDSESGLIYVYRDSVQSSDYESHCPVIKLSETSKPLVTAIDPDDDNKLWIINFKR